MKIKIPTFYGWDKKKGKSMKQETPNTRKANGEGTLRLRKDGRWEYRCEGKAFYSNSKVDKDGRQAKKKYREWKNDGSLKLDAIKTVEQWAIEWLRLYKEKNVSWITLSEYEIIINKNIIPSIGKVKLKDLREAHMQELMNYIADYSMSRKRKVRFLIKAIVKAAVKNNLCPNNIAEDISLAKEPEKEKEFFPRDELQMILDFSEKHRFGYVIKLLLYTGMRRGEILALTWGNVDIDKRAIYVRQAFIVENNKQTLGPPKGKRPRVIPIDDTLKNLLEGIPKTGMFVVNSNGNRMTFTRYHELYREFFDALEKDAEQHGEQSVTYRTAHKCRHTFVTYLLESGANIKAVQDIAGHAQLTTTQKYAHVDFEMLRNNITKLDYTNCGQIVVKGKAESK